MDERIVIGHNCFHFGLSKSLARYFGEESDLRVAVTEGVFSKGSG